MWVHLIAVLGLAAACGLWVALQRVNGGSDRGGGTGRCGACEERERSCGNRAPGSAGSGPSG